MFIVLYDNQMHALGKARTTYYADTWSIKRRTFAFDEMKITCKAYDNSAKACFVALHENRGSPKHVMLAGVPSTQDGKTSITAVDIRQIFDQKIYIDLENNVFTSVKNLYIYLLNLPKNYDNLGFDYSIDLSELDNNPPIWNDGEAIEKSAGVDNLWSILQKVGNIYDVYLDVIVDFVEHEITIVGHTFSELVSLKITDFGQAKVLNNNTVTNRAICGTLAEIAAGTYQEFYLQNDNVVVEASAVDSSKIIYPARIETFEDDDSAKAVSKGLETLYKNRFQQKVELEADNALGYIIRKIGKSTYADISGYNKADDNTTVRLPLYEISEDSKGKYQVTFGRLEL